MLIDSHAQPTALAALEPQFKGEIGAVIDRARAAGIGAMVEICNNQAAFPRVHAIAMANADVWCTVGTHPHEAERDQHVTASDLMSLAGCDRVVGIGECGLDYHYDLSPRDVQRQVFKAHVAAAQTSGLPLVVHTREADADMADLLERAHAERPFKILMHCYTSGAELARRAAHLGAWFSVSGIATFKAADGVRAVIAEMPGDRIIVETDCPYLAPAPLRGRRNEPAFLPHVLAKLAEIRGWALAEAESRTEAAFFNLFDRAVRP